MDYLLVDMGNTAVKWCLSRAQGKRLGPVHSIAWSQAGLSPRVAALGIARTIASQTGRGPSREVSRRQARAMELIYCSVAPAQRTQALVKALFEALGCEVRPFQSQASLSLPSDSFGEPDETWMLSNGYKTPRQLGSDRWAALAGLLASPSYWRDLIASGRPSRGGPMVLVSAGTATVMDWLTVNAYSTRARIRLDFQGGTIRPGYGLMREALGQSAAGLGSESPPVTKKAMRDGIGQAQVSGVFSRGVPRLIAVHGGFSRQWIKDFYANAAAEGDQRMDKKTHGVVVVHAPGLILQGLRAWRQTQS